MECQRLWRAVRQSGLLDEGSSAARLYPARREGLNSLIAVFLIYHLVRFRLLSQAAACGGNPDQMHDFLVALFRGVDFACVSASERASFASADVVEVLLLGAAAPREVEAGGGNALLAAVLELIERDQTQVPPAARDGIVQSLLVRVLPQHLQGALVAPSIGDC